MPEIETPKYKMLSPSLGKWFSLLCSFNAARHQKRCKINAELIFYQKTFISFNMCFEMCTCFNVIANVLMFMNSINKKKTHKLGPDLLKARLPQKYTQAETPLELFCFSWHYLISHTSKIKMQKKKKTSQPVMTINFVSPFPWERKPSRLLFRGTQQPF